ncbi:prepilin-type N-terminal cleavage/methylation domain-containing protein [Tateyamaria omphalii]|uniref:PulJ/GspJ family protein n=1 Tax=Tateyamaria omphalii TaxID=299262 RepID=UPI001C990F49|nr:prepilin-type N-terminal cleavage/methylation domain-containing protein [Tateyamaria omphalii]MBY5935571.1 prepilin-type N-terminal cleavage/methylation domain-containing protein [Tateyamaria omphalii]
MWTDGTHDDGLSLIELVVALAIFALVAVMGMQSLTGTLRARDRLTEIDTETAELSQALALLRNDLFAAVPMLFYPPGSAPVSALDQTGTALHLSVAGQPRGPEAQTDRHRVEWQLDPATGTLTRRAWPTLIPREASQIGPEIAVLEDVEALTLRTLWPEIGWVDGAVPPLGTITIIQTPEVDSDGPGAVPAAYVSTLPLAAELTLERSGQGPLRLLQALQ